MPTKRGDFAVGVIGNRVVCAGGLGGHCLALMLPDCIYIVLCYMTVFIILCVFEILFIHCVWVYVIYISHVLSRI